jgi:hypothetical protein
MYTELSFTQNRTLVFHKHFSELIIGLRLFISLLSLGFICSPTKCSNISGHCKCVLPLNLNIVTYTLTSSRLRCMSWPLGGFNRFIRGRSPTSSIHCQFNFRSVKKITQRSRTNCIEGKNIRTPKYSTPTRIESFNEKQNNNQNMKTTWKKKR